MDGREPVGVREVRTSWRRAGSAATRIAFWNALVLGAALLAVFAAGEAYLRTVWPFARDERTTELVPGVGMRLKPGSEVRSTNTLDFWTVERANSLGFLDREPPTPERAAASCHVAIVGDSFVEASEVRISDKVQVQLERMAAQRFPAWDVTVAAYGHSATGQVAQLPWWDEWIRHRPPKLVVLVFAYNDGFENGRRRRVGDPPYAMVRRDQGDGLELVVPGTAVSVRPSPPSLHERLWRFVPAALRPYAGRWFDRRLPIWRKNLSLAFPSTAPPPWSTLWRPRDRTFTAFALDEWQKRGQEAGSRLVALTGIVEPRLPQVQQILDDMERMAVKRGIPVVDPTSRILLRGHHPRDAHFPNDPHWNPRGHQWVAEALLEWLAGNPSVCERRDAAGVAGSVP